MKKKELLSLPEIFFKLSLEDKKFQKLLQQCKNDIQNMSMAHGQKKDEIVEDENSSQSSQIGFDSGLVKKNRIEEIRSNLLLNVSNFYTLKYIKLVFIFLALCSFIFCVLYIIVFWNLYNTLVDVSSVNVNLFQTTLWTTELVSIFLSLKTLFLKNTRGKNFYQFDFSNYDNDRNKTNYDYYSEMEDIVKDLYNKISEAYGILEMDIPKYLPKDDLFTKYWDHINVTNINSSVNEVKDDESFPMSIAQILSNSLSYITQPIYKNINENSFQMYENLAPLEKLNIELYFNYSTFIIIENSYDNLLPNQFKKLTEIPYILSDYNKARKASILLIILLYAGLMLLFCIAYFFLIHLTNKSMTDGLEKVTKIRLEKIEETLKKIQVFNTNLKRFRDKDTKAADDNKEDSELSDDQNPNPVEAKKTLGVNAVKKGKQNTTAAASSLVNSNGFNTDTKKYVPLNVLNHSFLHSVFVFCILCGFLIPVYIFSNDMVYNTNQLLLVQNHIFGELISSSASTVEVKCFMSYCQNTTNLNYSDLVDMGKIQEVIKGITTFSEVKNFYNEKFLLNACAAAIDKNTDEDKYNECLNENLIVSANNTDNLIKLVDNIVNNIYKEDEMNRKNESLSHIRYELFNTSYFNQMEEIFYKYIIPVGDNFAKLVNSDLDSYLSERKIMVLILVCVLGAIMIIYCLIFGIIFINQLIHYLSVSRCVMKIIPTSVIISTQDLENWIENKY